MLSSSSPLPPVQTLPADRGGGDGDEDEEEALNEDEEEEEYDDSPVVVRDEKSFFEIDAIDLCLDLFSPLFLKPNKTTAPPAVPAAGPHGLG